MKNLNKLDNFIVEKKVTVKRRYTEKYPAKNVSTSARVRNAILDAVADGHLTEDEVNTILAEIQAHKRWLKRNIGLFNISEDESGIKRYSLSPYGHRIRKATKTETINEALKVPYPKPGMKKVNMFVGRFQPFTLGHVKVFEKMYKENGLPVVVFLVRGKNPDPEKRPFDETLQQAMFAKMAKQYPFLETAIVVPNGAIDTLFAAARPTYEPVMWGYGTDRKKAYDSMINKDSYREQLGVDPDFSGYEIFRTDDNISASKVRNALKIDDEKTFKKMTPKSIHSFYKTLQDILQPIKENRNMKNLQTLNEFVNEDNMTKFTFDDAVDTAGELVRDEEKGIASALKALGAKKGVEISILTDTTEDDGEDLYDAIKKMKTLPIKSNVYDKAYHGKYKGKNVVVFDGGEDLFAYVKESVELNEEYIEVMDPIRLANAMGEIQQAWEMWKNGPATEPQHIRPAQKELKGWLDRWFKQNIK
jgi:nicotinamide mononucleotide adenylyltransferase